MKKVCCVVTLWIAAIAIAFAATPDKAAIEAREKAAWQAFKEKKADDFKKLLDKDIRCVYDMRISNLQTELEDMMKWDMKSFAFSGFDSFSDDPNVIVTTYVVKVEGTYNGQDVSGTYHSGSVWKQEKGEWLAIFHTNIKQAAAAK